MEHRRPNILLIFADQFRADALGCVTPYYRTPNLDALAQRGALFRRAYCNSPSCVPSRFSFACSQYPHQTGVWTGGPFTLDPKVPNWMQVISAAGYRTSVFGKTHFHPQDVDLRAKEGLLHALGLADVDEIPGPRASITCLSHMTAGWEAKGLWDSHRRDLEERFNTSYTIVRPSALPLAEYYDVYVGSRAREYLTDYALPDPWCCWVSFAGPHEPWDTPQPYASRFDPASTPKPIPRLAASASMRGQAGRAFRKHGDAPGANEIERIRASYAGAVALIDDQIGEILSALRAKDALKDTIIAFASDHGDMMGDQGLFRKGTFFESAVRIPIIIALPEGYRAARGHVSNALVELIDVAATLVDLAHGDIPETFSGRSLRRVLHGSAQTHRENALIEFRNSYCLVSGGLKAEFNADLKVRSIFNLALDPTEQFELAKERNLSGVRDELTALLRHRLADNDRWSVETGR